MGGLLTLNIWDYITLGIVAGFSSFFSELAKDFKNYLVTKLKRSRKKLLESVKNH